MRLLNLFQVWKIIFAIGQEIVCYNTVDEAAVLIEYYLENETEREKIKNRAVIKSRSSHTYKQRTIEFMKQIEVIYQQRHN